MMVSSGWGVEEMKRYSLKENKHLVKQDEQVLRDLCTTL